MKGQAEAGPFRASAEVENVEASHLGLEPQLAHQLDPARDVGLREVAVERLGVAPDGQQPPASLGELEQRRDNALWTRRPRLLHQPRELGGLLGRHLGLEADPGVAHVEIIFFSTPTPAATARSYSSGTVAESWSAIPVESKTVTWSSDCRPSSSPQITLPIWPATSVSAINPSARATLISPSSRHWRMSSTNTRARCSVRGSSSCSPFRSAPSAATCAPAFTQASSTSHDRACVPVTIT